MQLPDAISRKKHHFPVTPPLRGYLLKYSRETKVPVSYTDLLHAQSRIPLLDKKGRDTLWEWMLYGQADRADLNRSLTKIYSLLKTEGELSVMQHLSVERIDYCTFGNSNPFRVRIVNRFNDNYDYFYVKRADASRIYGLELEHILSPNRIGYFTDHDTLIEEHIAGLPGDQFIRDYMNLPNLNKVRVAKEFVKFNERCFVRLLGDMRAYNYVVDVTPDFEDEQYRVRPIDFDQQSYEGRKNLYLPQFFRNNNPIVELCLKHINLETAQQYQYEERTLMAKRLHASLEQTRELLACMCADTISTPEKILQLKEELALHHGTDVFLDCMTMGDVVRMNLKICLEKPGNFDL